MSEYLYLDWAAHTPADSSVLRAFCESECIGNPNAVHGAGREAKNRIDEFTASIAKFLCVQEREIIYTSGASEANNLAIKGFIRAGRHVGKHIISSPLEHPSVAGALTALQERGYEIDILDIESNGKIDIEQLKELLREDTVLVSICAVDSELGAVQPLAKIADLLKDFPNCRFHVDATQAIGKIPFDFKGLDSVSFSPHKFFGICGCGVLWKRDGLAMEPLIHGGTGTTVYRSGTPAVSLIAATAQSVYLAISELSEQYEYVRLLNSVLRKRLSEYPLIRINSPDDAIPHILNISVKGIKAVAFQQALDKRGVCVSVKSACSVPNTPSRAVYAVSRDRNNALSSWRISMSKKTTVEEIDAFLNIFDSVYKEVIREQGV